MPVELNPSSGWLDARFECPRHQLIDPRLSVAIYDDGEHAGRVDQRIDGIELIRSRPNFDSLAIPKCGDSHSPKQELRCDQGFRYVKILMVKVSGALRGRRGCSLGTTPVGTRLILRQGLTLRCGPSRPCARASPDHGKTSKLCSSPQSNGLIGPTPAVFYSP
ncbi:hypothetical protein DSM25559_4385 [Agrobacterium rosae]|uniref:Uncharacterized protein n=1 Tax=Agrobacterium rosae TaxID=1972867 RepID=A0A1R3U0Y8_9HYPH|nr:hypothetical protein DSM25559_4385 [Agrobacterium rosae]